MDPKRDERFRTGTAAMLHIFEYDNRMSDHVFSIIHKWANIIVSPGYRLNLLFSQLYKSNR